MTTVLILLAIALIICLVFMGAVFYMLLIQEKAVERQIHVTNTLSEKFVEIQNDMQAVMDEKDKLYALNGKSEALIAEANMILKNMTDALKEAKDASGHARDTIQEVRRMLKLDPEGTQKLVYENGRPKEIRSLNETFKFEEKEEDEDKPQS